MPMPHRTFAQLAKRRLVGKEGRDRIREVNALLAELPDYKNGPYADLRKWLTSEIEETRVRSNAVHRDSIAVRREGAAQIALVGPPNVGKSSILQALSEIQIKTGDYPFTTLRPIPALTRIGGVLVQLVEIPGLIEGATEDRGGGRALLGVLRFADAIVYCTRADGDPEELRPVIARGRAGGDRQAGLPRGDPSRRGGTGRHRPTPGGVSRTSRSCPSRSSTRRASSRVPRRGLAPDRADPRPPAHERARRTPEPLALEPGSTVADVADWVHHDLGGEVHGRPGLGSVGAVRRPARRSRARRPGRRRRRDPGLTRG